MKIDNIDDGLFYLTSARTLNNRLIVSVYKKEGLKTQEKNGFATIAQKVTLKGLRVLVDAKLSDNTLVPAGSIAYIKEEELHTKPWAQKILECDSISEPFLIADVNNVEMIVPPKQQEPLKHEHS